MRIKYQLCLYERPLHWVFGERCLSLKSCHMIWTSRRSINASGMVNSMRCRGLSCPACSIGLKFSKKKPANPHADTFVNRHKQHLSHFLDAHPYLAHRQALYIAPHPRGAFWLDTLIWHVCGRTLCLTHLPTWRSCWTLFLDNFFGHSYLTH